MHKNLQYKLDTIVYTTVHFTQFILYFFSQFVI